MVPHKPQGKRTLGLLKDKFQVPDNFSDEDPEISEMFYGKNE